MALIYKTPKTRIKSPAGERWVEARISTTSVDRDGDVMLPSGVDLSDYLKNPVVLLGHDPERQIGRAQSIARKANGINAKVEFTARPPFHPEALEWVPDTVHYMFQTGHLKAFSVGFIIDDARDAHEKDRERFGGMARRVVTRWKLLEFSAVTIPANQDALALAVSKGQIKGDSWVLKQLTGKVEQPGGSYRMLCIRKPRQFKLSHKDASG